MKHGGIPLHLHRSVPSLSQRSPEYRHAIPSGNEKKKKKKKERKKKVAATNMSSASVRVEIMNSITITHNAALNVKQIIG